MGEFTETQKKVINELIERALEPLKELIEKQKKEIEDLLLKGNNLHRYSVLQPTILLKQ